ncbi:alpha-xylosidase [Konateibacter massiliensis]|uniref:alpha-xylosidase n=1 Tax=Konateibacter massiliensis TaxID=2002841 RepID=UPI000C14F88D|nr:alpha-xylosidase [Konateibacter massiliensis]
MKFQNGCWLFKEGYECFSPQHVYEIRKEEKQVVLCAPTSRIQHKGDTLGGINLTIKITAPMPEIIRVQTFHHMGVQNKGPEFELDLSQPQSLETKEEDNILTVKSGNLSLLIDLENWSMRYERGSKLLTKSGWRDLAYIKEDWKGFAYDKGKDNAYMRQQLGLSVGELIYGLGERFTPFVKNGQSVSIWNEDGGTSTEQSYKNIPFYLSNRGYGVFVNHPELVEFEVATEQVAKVEFSVAGESLDYFVIDGPSMKEVLKRYTSLTGKPSLPAQWTFGLWLSTSFTTDYDEKTVMSFIDGMLERDIPLSVFHFDCCWMREFHWTDFIWDERVFPDPKGMLRRIKEKGIKICVWINSYIGQESALFAEGMEKGYFLKRANGDVWQWDMWQPGLAIVDFTNPEACRWYQDKLEMLLDMGVDCFKTDFGERIPVDAVYHNGADPVKMHNYYTYLYNKAVYEVLEKKRGKEEAVLFARSATVGGQKFPVHWGGDCWSDYESMEESLRGGLSLTSSGFGFWSHDIGGFESKSTPDVYKRWAAFGLLSTHSRLHGSTSYRVPWAYDEEAVDVVRFFTKLKLKLLPYFYSQAVYTAETGIPMMRSMALEFDKDRNCQYLDKQYMLGDSLLAAPIFNENGIAEYYLPKGSWTNYLTGEKAEGGTWRKESHGYLSVPLWVRENSIIPIGFRTPDVNYSFDNNLELQVFELKDKAEVTVYQNQKKLTKVSLAKNKNEIVCTLDRTSELTLRFINCTLSFVKGGQMKIEGRDTLVMTKKGETQIIAKC